MQGYEMFYKVNPWTAVWFRPRKAFRAVFENDYRRAIAALIILGSLENALSYAREERLGEELGIPGIVPLVLLIGPLIGWISASAASSLFQFTGSLLGGTATKEEVRACIGFAALPFAVLLLLGWIPLIAAYGAKLFAAADPFGALRFEQARTAAFLWSAYIFVGGLSEANRFSWWRSAAAAFLPLAALFGLIGLILGAAALFGQ